MELDLRWRCRMDDGAPEVIISHLDGDYSGILRQVNDFADDGNRVLLIVRFDGAALSDYETDPKLDSTSQPVALVLCSEHIRGDAERRSPGSVSRACAVASFPATIPSPSVRSPEKYD